MSHQTSSESILSQLLGEYYNTPVEFARDVLGFEPTDQQCTFLNALANNKRVTVRSGHGIGKTKAEASVAWWFMTTRFKAIVPCTAPSSHQLYDILWKELMWCHGKLPAVIREAFECTSTRIWHKSYKEEWYLQARTARKDKPEALQGFHGDHLLILVEEAGGVESVIFETIEGALTHEDNRILLVGNPTRTHGYFYDSHNQHKDEWAHFCFSSLDSPLYSQAQGESLRKRYGERSSVYRVRVLGEFPDAEPDQLIPLPALEHCVDLDIEIPENPMIVWALDVARMGDDESVLAMRVGRKILPLHWWEKTKSVDLARRIEKIYKATPKEFRPKQIVIDTVGVGSGVYDILEAKGYPVVEFMASWNASDKIKYANIKAELYDMFADMIVRGRISLPSVDAYGDRDNELIAQGAAVRYDFDEQKGGSTQIRMVSKKQMKDKFSLPSPDRFEACVMTMYEEAIVDHWDDEDEWQTEKKVENGYDYSEFDVCSYNLMMHLVAIDIWKAAFILRYMLLMLYAMKTRLVMQRYNSGTTHVPFTYRSTYSHRRL